MQLLWKYNFVMSTTMSVTSTRYPLCHTLRLLFKVLDYDQGWEPHDTGAAGTMPCLVIFVGEGVSGHQAQDIIHVRQTLPLGYTISLHAYCCVLSVSC